MSGGEDCTEHGGVRPRQAGVPARLPQAGARRSEPRHVQPAVPFARRRAIPRLFPAGGVDLSSTVYALELDDHRSVLVDVPWAHFRSTKAAAEMHTLLDLRGNIASFIHVSDGKLHDVHALDMLLPEPLVPSMSWIGLRREAGSPPPHTASILALRIGPAARPFTTIRNCHSGPNWRTLGARPQTATAPARTRQGRSEWARGTPAAQSRCCAGKSSIARCRRPEGSTFRMISAQGEAVDPAQVVYGPL